MNHAAIDSVLSKCQRLLRIALPGLLLVPGSVWAQPTKDGSSLSVGGIVSIQPADEKANAGPCLDGALGGTVLGLVASVETVLPSGLTLAIEGSTTLALTGEQTGRLVDPEPQTARHRDTLLSFLPGFRHQLGRRWIVYKAGASLVIGQSKRGDTMMTGTAGRWAVTGGADWLVAFRPQFAVVSTVRYSYLRRGDFNYNLGLGHHVLRAGIGLEF